MFHFRRAIQIKSFSFYKTQHQHQVPPDHSLVRPESCRLLAGASPAVVTVRRLHRFLRDQGDATGGRAVLHRVPTRSPPARGSTAASVHRVERGRGMSWSSALQTGCDGIHDLRPSTHGLSWCDDVLVVQSATPMNRQEVADVSVWRESNGTWREEKLFAPIEWAFYRQGKAFVQAVAHGEDLPTGGNKCLADVALMEEIFRKLK